MLAVLDARRGEAFAAPFGAGVATVPAAVSVDPAALAGLAAPGWLAVGDGAVRYRAELEAGGLEVPPDDDPRHRVGGAPLVRLAAAGDGGSRRYARPRLRAPSGRGDPSSTRGSRAVTDVALDIRRLTYADLPQVIAIERRAFPTPWSLAMFVLELSKPGGSALPFAATGRSPGT